MNPGQLKEPITIVRAETQTNRFGEEKAIRRELLHTRAQIRHDRGFRGMENDEIVHTYDITFIVWLYVAKAIKDTDEVVWGSRRYRITALEPVEESKILYIKAVSVNE